MERRMTFSRRIVSARAEGKPKLFQGLAAVFYDGSPATEYELVPGLVERIDRGAFDRALEDGQDVRGLFNHDPNQVLGRTKSGTMRLRTDDEGLEYRIEPGDTQVARDVAAHIERGDVTGSSFAFIPRTVEWSDEGEGKAAIEVRTIKDVDLLDVGPVTFPAYEATTAGARGRAASGGTECRAAGDLSAVLAERDAWRARQSRLAAMDERIARATLRR